MAAPDAGAGSDRRGNYVGGPVPPGYSLAGGGPTAAVYKDANGNVLLVDKSTGKVYSQQTAAQAANFEANSGTQGFGNAIKDALSPLAPAQADLSGVKKAQEDAFGLQQALGAERAGYTGAYDPTQRAQLYTQQQQNIAGLTAQANGTAPSAAELQLRAAAARGEAGQYGLAAALQGRNTGAALRSARIGSANILGQENEQAAALRAQEQARAQSELAQALSGMQALNAGYRAQDIGEKGNLLGAQTGALGAEVGAATGAANASTAAAGAKNQLYGGLIGTGANIFARAV